MLVNYAKWYSFTPPQRPSFPLPLTVSIEEVAGTLGEGRCAMPRQRIHHSRRTIEVPDDFPERLKRFQKESGVKGKGLQPRQGPGGHGRYNGLHLTAEADPSSEGEVEGSTAGKA